MPCGFRENCVVCGRFVSPSGPGVSWSQTWGYDMSGTPTLYDARFRCAPCTDKHGPMLTNCHNPQNYSGRNASEEREVKP